MKKQWRILTPDPHAVNEISAGLACSPVVAAILVNRKIDSLDAAGRFMDPSLNHIRPPFAMAGMDVAVERLARAVAKKEKVLVFGDYDADGVTATAVLYEFFRQIGSDVSYYVPHRISEGYSLRPAHIQNHALPAGVKLIVTADCGSASYGAVETARRAGIDVIVSDHHKISSALPKALAVINPNRHDCDTGYEHLSGVGVAFSLVICLRKRLREMNFWADGDEPNLKTLCDLVAIGTVADIVPLIEENRIFTKAGLEVIASESRCGIKALAKESRIDIHAADAADIAFRLAPRINAAGRMDHAALAVELLVTGDPEKADRIARRLNTLNAGRQKAEQQIVAGIHRKLDAAPRLLGKHSLVLDHSDWHEGIIGIAASRAVEQFFRPTVLISVKDGIGKGSARSIPGFDLYQGLSACAEDLEAFGGHAMAAGLTIKSSRIEIFRQHFESIVQATTRPDDFVPTIRIDSELNLNRISPGLIDEIEALQPFGSGNPEPLFMARGIQVLSPRIVGQKHRRFLLNQADNPSPGPFPAIQFNIDPSRPLPEHVGKIAFRLRWNRWRGKRTPQLIVEEAQA